MSLDACSKVEELVFDQTIPVIRSAKNLQQLRLLSVKHVFHNSEQDINWLREARRPERLPILFAHELGLTASLVDITNPLTLCLHLQRGFEWDMKHLKPFWNKVN